MIDKILKFIVNRDYRFVIMANAGLYDWMEDRKYLEKKYKSVFGKPLDLNHPKTFNEKLQWLKLFDRKPEYSLMVDKYLVKEYVANKIGRDYIIETIGVWDSENDIDFDELPDQFVLKCNHNSGLGMCICKDKKKLDIKRVRKKLGKGLRQNYYLLGREWPYKNVERKIIAEKYMVDEKHAELRDYKVLCFNGAPKLIEYHAGRFTNHQTQDIYNTEWEKCDISQSNVSGFGKSNINVPKPLLLDRMLELSSVLAEGIPHVRIDWYIVEDALYFGEITFFDGSGFDGFDNEEDDLMIGNWIKLPDKKNM